MTGYRWVGRRLVRAELRLEQAEGQHVQQVLDGAALGARLCGLGDCPLRGRVCLERRGHLLRVAVLGLVDLARLDGLLKLGEGLLKLLAVGRSAVLAQHTLAEERHLGGARGTG